MLISRKLGAAWGLSGVLASRSLVWVLEALATERAGRIVEPDRGRTGAGPGPDRDRTADRGRTYGCRSWVLLLPRALPTVSVAAWTDDAGPPSPPPPVDTE